jgi:prepilin peptidase CpaA
VHISVGIFIIACAVACYTDLRWRRVPNPVTYGAMAIVLAATAPGGIAPVLWALAAIGGTIVVGSIVFGLGLIGGGDIKLLAVGAAAIGFPGFLTVLMYVACAGGVIAVAYALREGRLRTVVTAVSISALTRTRVVPASGSRRIPYALAISAGSLFYIASESIAPWFRLAH